MGCQLQLMDGRLVYSATDLVGFVECTHLANLERAVVDGHLRRPMRDDPVLDRIAQRGIEHEARFLRDLQARGLKTTELRVDGDHPRPAAQQGNIATLEAMRMWQAVTVLLAGALVIAVVVYQRRNRWDELG